MRSVLSVAAAVAALSLTGASLAVADDRAPAAENCFHTGQVFSFYSPDDKVLYVRAGASQVYALQMQSLCQDVKWARDIALEPKFSGKICAGKSAKLTVGFAGPSGPRRCRVQSVRKLTDAEAQALRDSW